MSKGGSVPENQLNSDELLSKVLDSLKTKINDFNYNHWFKLAQWNFEADAQVRIKIPNKFVRDWILEKYIEVIKFEFFKLTGTEHKIIVQVDSNLTGQLNLPIASQTVVPLSQTASSPRKLAAANRPTSSNLNPRYSFDSFIVGGSNQFVHAACRAVAGNPAMNYNPLFIYGGVGLGKTHLLNAIGMEIQKKHPDWNIVMVTGEHFTNEVINSIRFDKTSDFRQKYRTQCDVLLIDDIQFIAGKERTMEEFFHTFNALYEARKQIILTSDTLPKDIPHLEERLRSRFSWGLLADIQKPDFETRAAILKCKADAEKINLPNDVCDFLATQVKTNVRDLEGCLIRVSAFASLANVPLTVNLSKEVLKNVLTVSQPQLTIEGIQQAVAHYFHLEIADLKSHRRQKHLAVPRQIAMYLCKKHVKASYPEIGLKFGGKDHTTVLHAFQKISGSMDKETSLKNPIDFLEKAFAM